MVGISETLAPNRFLAGLRAGVPQIGCWASLMAHYATEILGGAGFDWVLLDMEHAPNELHTILPQLQVMERYDGTALVRPPWNDTVILKKLLDAGTRGFLIPMVQSAEEARAAVAAVRYPPRGVRGVSGSTRANQFGRIKDYFDRIEEETALLVQAETLAALEVVEDIASVDGVDGVFFGPADIAADMGYLGQPMAEAVWEKILPAAQKVMDLGVPVGTLVFDPTFAKTLIDRGFTFVATGSDVSLLTSGADRLAKEMADR